MEPWWIAAYNKVQTIKRINKMALEEITPRIALIMLLGIGITILFVMGGVALSNRDLQHGTIFVGSGTILALIFFRKRLVVLFIGVLTFLLVNAGLTVVFHPTIIGILVTVGSGVALLALGRWHAAKYPNLRRQDWKKLFDNKAE
jgi:hypothetical protein